MDNQVMPRTFVAYVEDQPGVLNRVVSLFRRRNYNIESLNVGRTHEAGVSRMTVVVQADADTARRLEANLYKLVNVLRVRDITETNKVSRDLALIKVRCDDDRRPELLRVCEVSGVRVVDMGAQAVVVEVSGEKSKIDGLVHVLRPFGIAEMVQSGVIAMTCSEDTVSACTSGVDDTGRAQARPAAA